MTRVQSCCLGCVAALALFSWNPRRADAGEPEAISGTVIGGGNTLLAEGSLALQTGRVADGIRLTEEGLKTAADAREAAAGHSNLCGGYALLREWTQALQHCDAAIELDPTNWQPLNNRAAVHAGQGRYDLALSDLRAGLELAPRSSVLQKSLAVVEHNQKIVTKRGSSLMRS
jgi:tetratricopeptide (TPR) repeat protein